MTWKLRESDHFQENSHEMPALNSQSCLSAYRAGYSTNRAIHQAEFCWLRGEPGASFPVSVETEFDAFGRLLDRFTSLLTSRRVRQAGDRLGEQIRRLHRAMRQNWMNEDHVSARSTIESSEPEEQFSVEGQLVTQLLAVSELSDFWAALESFTCLLPRDLQNLMAIGGHVSNAFYHGRSGPHDSEFAELQAETFVKSVLPDRIARCLDALTIRFIRLQEIPLRFDGLSHHDALLRFERYHEEVQFLLEDGLDLDQRPLADASTRRVPHRLSHALEWYEYGLANLPENRRSRVTHQQIYALLQDCDRPNRPESPLPAFETWSRYVRQALRILDAEPPQDQTTPGDGRSIVTQALQDFDRE